MRNSCKLYCVNYAYQMNRLNSTLRRYKGAYRFCGFTILFWMLNNVYLFYQETPAAYICIKNFTFLEFSMTSIVTDLVRYVCLAHCLVVRLMAVGCFALVGRFVFSLPHSSFPLSFLTY